MIPESIKKLAQKVRTEIYGRDVRESIAKSMEVSGETSNEANERSKDTDARQTDVENRFDDQIAGNTDSDEVIDARRPEGGESYPTLRKRLDDEHKEVTTQLAQTDTKVNTLSSNKVDKDGNEQVSWGMLDQEAKENVSGGKVAVVGKDGVNTTNIVNNAVTSKKRTPLGNWGYLVGVDPINFNLEESKVEFPQTIDVLSGAHWNTVQNHPDLSIDIYQNSKRYILAFDVINEEFLVVNNVIMNQLSEYVVFVGVFRINTTTPSKTQVLINGNYLIDGLNTGSSGQAQHDYLLHGTVFYRKQGANGGVYIEGNQVIIKKMTQFYLYPFNSTTYSNRLILEQSDLEFEWNHNVHIWWDILNNEIYSNLYEEPVRKFSVLLLKNIDGELVGGKLFEQINQGALGKIEREAKHLEKEYSNVPVPEFESDITMSGFPNGAVVVGDEYWAFTSSNDQHTDQGQCVRWKINLEDENLTNVGSFKHNWGHCNSLDYRKETDTLILGNGSSDYGLSGKILIIPNVSDLKNKQESVLKEDAVVIDVGMSFGSKVNVVWGQDNGCNFNVAHVISNDNKNVREIQLGQGDNDLKEGTMLTGKSEQEFNGTYRVIKEYSQSDGDDVIQGAFFGRDGYLYVGLGHSGKWYARQNLNSNGTISSHVFKNNFYKKNGDLDSGYTQSISEYEDLLILRIVKGSEHYAHLFKKP